MEPEEEIRIEKNIKIIIFSNIHGEILSSSIVIRDREKFFLYLADAGAVDDTIL